MYRLQYSIESVIMDNCTWNISVEKDISLKRFFFISVATAYHCSRSCPDESHFGTGTNTTCDVRICWMAVNTYLLSVVVMTLVNHYDVSKSI